LSILLKNARYVLSSIWREPSNRGQRVKRVLQFFGWQFWKRAVRMPVVVELFNGHKFRAYPDCQMSAGAIYTRIPDSQDILYLRKHIRQGTLIDVGANVSKRGKVPTKTR